jgi:hypothetical protein
MRSRQRHFTLGNSGALACWDSRPLTQSDGTSITSWQDRISSRAADRATNSPVLKVAIQGGQPILRFAATTNAMIIASNDITRNKGRMMLVSVASVANASTSAYQTVFASEVGTSVNVRCGIYLRSSKVEAGGRRLDANAYQFVQSGSTSNNRFTIGSAFFDWANSQLYAYERGTETARSGGFQTSGNTSNTASAASIGGGSFDGGSGGRLNGDIGICVFVESSSASFRKRFEHAAAYSFKIDCN